MNNAVTVALKRHAQIALFFPDESAPAFTAQHCPGRQYAPLAIFKFLSDAHMRAQPGSDGMILDELYGMRVRLPNKFS